MLNKKLLALLASFSVSFSATAQTRAEVCDVPVKINHGTYQMRNVKVFVPEGFDGSEIYRSRLERAARNGWSACAQGERRNNGYFAAYFVPAL